MSLKDRLSNLKGDDLKDRLKEGVEKAKEMESKAEASDAGGKAKAGFSQLRDKAKSRFGKS
jgi:hypothetical protein